MKRPTEYTYRCNKCGFQMDALSKYQRKLIKQQHRSHPCFRGIVFDYDRHNGHHVHITRKQISDMEMPNVY